MVMMIMMIMIMIMMMVVTIMIIIMITYEANANVMIKIKLLSIFNISIISYLIMESTPGFISGNRNIKTTQIRSVLQF